MEVAILIVLIVLNGLFAMSEIALVAARKSRLSARAASGDKAAQAAIALGEDPTKFLSTVQIGITSIGLLSGIVGESALAGPLALWIQQYMPLHPATAHFVATVSVVVIITYLSIVVGELVPKRLGQIHAERMACLVARPMHGLSLVSRPFVWLLSCSTRGLMRLFGLNPDERETVTMEEIQAVIDEGSQSGLLEDSQQAMLKNIFRLEDRPVSSIMQPRSELVYLDVQFTPQENLKRLRENDYAWFPVCNGGLENPLGAINVKTALFLFIEDGITRLNECLEPAVFVPETLTSLELLVQFRSKGMQVAFIVDEYGDVQGVVTVHDLLKILTGQLNASQETDWAIRREDGSWLVDGSIPVPELKDQLGLKAVPEEKKGHYSLLSGMLMYLMGRVPREGEHVEWEGWRFEIVDMDGNRIDKVLVSREA